MCRTEHGSKAEAKLQSKFECDKMKYKRGKELQGGPLKNVQANIRLVDFLRSDV